MRSFLPLPQFWVSLAVAVPLAAASLTPAAAAQVTAPVPHRAVYEVQESLPLQGEGLLLRGVEAFEWSEDCDGATLFQRSALVAGEGEEPVYQSESQLSAWEARDGSRMRFFYEQQSNMEGTEETGGIAERLADGRVSVSYRGSDAKPVVLPAETMFPWQYFRLTLETAAAGGRSVSRPVLRGTLPDTDPAQLTTLILGRAAVTAESLADVSGDTGGLTGEGWRMVTAVYEDPDETAPTFEITETLAPNGVRVKAAVVFSDLTLNVKLRAVEVGESPVCK